MTKQEAIKILSSYDLNMADVDGKPYNAEEQVEAFDMAIKALEQEPKCEDCKWNTWDNNCMVEYRGCRFEPKNGE